MRAATVAGFPFYKARMESVMLMTLKRRKHDRFDGIVNGEVVVTSHRPIFDGARALIKRGHSEGEILTVRHINAAHDSFTPQTLGELAKWSTTESGNVSLRRTKWAANPLFAG